MGLAPYLLARFCCAAKLCAYMVQDTGRLTWYRSTGRHSGVRTYAGYTSPKLISLDQMHCSPCFLHLEEDGEAGVIKATHQDQAGYSTYVVCAVSCVQ